MQKFFGKMSIALLSIFSLMYVAGAQQIQMPVTYTQTGSNAPVGAQLNNLMLTFQGLSTTLYGSLFIVALIVFFFGLFKYMWPGHSSEDKNAGWKYMVYGLVSLTIMFSVYGIVWFLSGSLGIGVGGEVPLPKPPTLRANVQ